MASASPAAFLLVATLLSADAAATLFSTPPLGWNSCNINCGNATFPNADFVRATARQLRERGLLDAGYVYLNLDEGWALPQRSTEGQLQVPDPAKFPDGMRNVSDFVASMGFGFGLYTSLSPMTCGGKSAGSCDHEAADAHQYLDWGISYLKDDGCGGCHQNLTGPTTDDWALESYRAMQASLRSEAEKRGVAPLLFSTESTPNVTAMSARPDLYGNMWRSGHDSVPSWGSVMSQANLAANLHGLAHNDSGRGGFFNDLDLLQVGWGDFARPEDLDKVVAHLTMHVLLKSPLLISTYVSELSEEQVALLAHGEALAVHQDPLGVQARRVASAPLDDGGPAMVAPHATLFALRPCEAGNPRQLWRLDARGGGDEASSLAARLWTRDEDGKRWCVGGSNWARPAEVVPCSSAADRMYSSAAVAASSCEWNCGQGNVSAPCCHGADSFQASSVPACLADVPKTEYCAPPALGGLVGEGTPAGGCFVKLQCGDPTQVITAVEFADWGRPARSGAGGCAFERNSTCSRDATDVVRARCVGKAECSVSTSDVAAAVGDPCRGVHKRLAIRGVGCSAVSPPPAFEPDRIIFGPSLEWDSGEGATGPVPHSRYVGANSMATDIGNQDAWWWGDGNAAPEGAGRTLHPSSKLWCTKDGGEIVDGDSIGGAAVRRPAGEWCAEALSAGVLEVWVAELKGGRRAVGLLNRAGRAANITAKWSELGLRDAERAEVRDVWASGDLGAHAGSFTASVPATGARMLVLTPVADAVNEL